MILLSDVFTDVSLSRGVALGKKPTVNAINIFVVYILILMDENKEYLCAAEFLWRLERDGNRPKTNVPDVGMIYQHKYHKQQPPREF